MLILRQQRLQKRSNDRAISGVIERLLQRPKGVPTQSDQPDARPQQKNHPNRSVPARKGEGTRKVTAKPDHPRKIAIDKAHRAVKSITKSEKTRV